MKYKYVPDTYDYSIIDKRFEDEEFVELQNKYREFIEKLLKHYIDFKDIDNKIGQVMKVPKKEDLEYNFYHKFSSLNSDYIYLRNNYHIENLNDDEIEVLKNNKIDYEFLNKTINRVINEEGDMTFYGSPVPKYLVDTKGLVFEFAYDQLQLLEVKELQNIEKIISVIDKYLKDNLKALNIPISMITYNGINDIYKPNTKPENNKSIMN